MATNLQTGTEASTTSLLAGIVNDAQELIKQQLALFKHEIRQDIQKTKESALSLAFSVPLVLLGVTLLSFMLVHLLHWLTLPSGADPAHLPLWACYGLVGIVLLAAGGIAAYLGVKRLEQITPLDDQAAQALKENLEWTTKPK